MPFFCRIGRHDWEYVAPKHRRCKSCGKEEEFRFIPIGGGYKNWVPRQG